MKLSLDVHKYSSNAFYYEPVRICITFLKTGVRRNKAGEFSIDISKFQFEFFSISYTSITKYRIKSIVQQTKYHVYNSEYYNLEN